MIVGFTGSHHSSTFVQEMQFRAWVESRWKEITEFHHGDCVGWDALAHDIIREYAPSCVIHIRPPIKSRLRAFKTGDVVYPEEDYLVRNRHIVEACDGLLACSRSMTETLRGSGTWHTIRIARELERPHVIFLPNGIVQHVMMVPT